MRDFRSDLDYCMNRLGSARGYRLICRLSIVLAVAFGKVGGLGQEASFAIGAAPVLGLIDGTGAAQEIEWSGLLGPSSAWNTLATSSGRSGSWFVEDLTIPGGGNRFYRVPPSVAAHSRLVIGLVRTLSIRGERGSRVLIEWMDGEHPASRWSVLTNLPMEEVSRTIVDPDGLTRPARRYRILSIGSEPSGRPRGFVWISAGRFTMGSSDGEMDRGWEGPLTEATVSRGFWMGQYEVTQQEYAAVKGAHNNSRPGSDMPVETITWVDAMDYCSKLTELEGTAGLLPPGYVYRLPTEAEWEYACRAGTATRFSHGDDLGYARLGDYAWFAANAGGTSHRVGAKLPNPWGLYDMHGSVWEWCLDWYGPHSGGEVTDPRLSEMSFVGFFRSVRGGCWSNVGGGCRSASRNGFPPALAYYCLGFRVVLARPL